MRPELLHRLSEITLEEAALLRGESLNLSNYNRDGDPVVDPGKMLPDGALFGIRTHTRFADFPRHSHKYVEMIYQVQGKTEHLINGVEPLTLHQGQLLLLGRGTEHSIKATSAEDIAVNFFLIPAFFDNAAISIGGNSALSVFLMGNLKNKKLQSGHLVFDASQSPLIENLLENLIFGQFEGVSPGVQQLTLEVLLRHLSGMSENLVVQTHEDRNQATVLSVLSKIETQVRVNLSEIAEELQLDVTTLSRLVQRYTGCTFTELLHTARFNRAVEMLRETDLSIADIAAAIGYENAAFFYRRFSQRYGCTPAEYRKTHRQTTQNRI